MLLNKDNILIEKTAFFQMYPSAYYLNNSSDSSSTRGSDRICDAYACEHPIPSLQIRYFARQRFRWVGGKLAHQFYKREEKYHAELFSDWLRAAGRANWIGISVEIRCSLWICNIGNSRIFCYTDSNGDRLS